MTDYTRCNNCNIDIPFIKDKDRYVRDWSKSIGGGGPEHL